MKKLRIISILSIFLYILSGCSSINNNINESNKMYIINADMNEDEKNLIELLGVEDEFKIFDFVVDENIRSIQLNTYELKNGEWNLMVGGGGQSFTDTKGRLSIKYDNIANGVKKSIQSEHTGGGDSYEVIAPQDLSDYSRVESIFSGEKRIEYDKEIPLAVQIFASENNINSNGVDSFYNPDLIKNYDYAYAITVMFSEKTLNELSANAENTNLNE